MEVIGWSLLGWVSFDALVVLALWARSLRAGRERPRAARPMPGRRLSSRPHPLA